MTMHWDDEYLKDAFADEIALAKIHPAWRRTYKTPATLTLDAPLVYMPRTTTHPFSGHNSRLTFSTKTPELPPHWRRSWSAAGPLSTYPRTPTASSRTGSTGAGRRSSNPCGSDLNSTTRIYSKQAKKNPPEPEDFSFLISDLCSGGERGIRTPDRL